MRYFLSTFILFLNFAFAFGALVIYPKAKAVQALLVQNLDVSETQKAKDIVDRFFTVFNSNRYPFGWEHRYYVDLYLRLGEVQKAEMLAEQIWMNEKKVNNEERIKEVRLYFQYYATTYKNTFLERLVSTK
jgi:hypothetical protein